MSREGGNCTVVAHQWRLHITQGTAHLCTQGKVHYIIASLPAPGRSRPWVPSAPYRVPSVAMAAEDIPVRLHQSQPRPAQRGGGGGGGRGAAEDLPVRLHQSQPRPAQRGGGGTSQANETFACISLVFLHRHQSPGQPSSLPVLTSHALQAHVRTRLSVASI